MHHFLHIFSTHSGNCWLIWLKKRTRKYGVISLSGNVQLLLPIAFKLKTEIAKITVVYLPLYTTLHHLQSITDVGLMSYPLHMKKALFVRLVFDFFKKKIQIADGNLKVPILLTVVNCIFCVSRVQPLPRTCVYLENICGDVHFIFQ